jgi:phytoene dehydrogenase-like protein
MRTLADVAQSASLLGADPAGRMPMLGIANYGAIDSGLADGGPTLVSVVGTDRWSNWKDLDPHAEKERRARWLDAVLAALDREYPGFASAVGEQVFLNARSMRGFLNTPEGAIYGFAPWPPQRGIFAAVARCARSPIEGLYLASAFAGGGFSGAMLAGANAAELALADRR